MPGTLTVVPKNATASVRLLLITRESAVLSMLWSIGEARKWQLESATIRDDGISLSSCRVRATEGRGDIDEERRGLTVRPVDPHPRSG